MRQAALRQHSVPAIQSVLLACGPLAVALYVAANVVVPLQYIGYDAASQVVRELSAIDAPTRDLWSLLILPYGLLTVAFGWGVWKAGGKSILLRWVGAILAIGAAIGAFWRPMHRREVLAAGGGDLSDTLHIVFTAVWALLALVAMVLAAVALSRRFRLFTAAMIAVLLVFGVLTSIASPALQRNEPTLWIGIAERINMAAYFLWLFVFALALLRRKEG